MDDVVDIRELIKRPIGEVEDVPEFRLLPVCHYFAKVIDADLNGRAKTKADGSEGTPCWVFYVSPQEVGPDATPEQRKELEGMDLGSFEFPTRKFYGVNAATLWIHPNPRVMNSNREFFLNMGFPRTMPMDECANQMVGRDVLIGIGVEDSEVKRPDGTTVTYKNNVLTELTRDPRKK